MFAFMDVIEENEYEDNFEWENMYSQALVAVRISLQCNPLVRLTFSYTIVMDFIAPALAFRTAALVIDALDVLEEDYEVEEMDYDY